MRKPIFAYAKTKTQISCAVTAQLISAFVFATRIVQFIYYLNPKFRVSSHLLWLYSPVCVGPGRKPRRPVFSQRGSYNCLAFMLTIYACDCSSLDAMGNTFMLTIYAYDCSSLDAMGNTFMLTIYAYDCSSLDAMGNTFMLIC